jgi:uncharacterized protein (TIGR02145 family)
MKTILVKNLNMFICLSTFFSLFSCGSGDSKNGEKLNTSDTSQVLQESIYDGSEVKIGDQVWMAENLNVEVFSNGEPILEAKTATEWNDAAKNHKPAWCYYDNDAKNGTKFGKLYNFYAVTDPRGLAPKGWHVASHEEWITLTGFLGSPAGGKLKKDSGWDHDGWEGNGNNSSGFNGLPGGVRIEDGKFLSLNSYGYFWTSTECDLTTGYGRMLAVYDDVDRDESSKSNGESVRCIKD